MSRYNYIFKKKFLVLLIDVGLHLDWIYAETSKGKYKGWQHNHHITEDNKGERVDDPKVVLKKTISSLPPPSWHLLEPLLCRRLPGAVLEEEALVEGELEDLVRCGAEARPATDVRLLLVMEFADSGRSVRSTVRELIEPPPPWILYAWANAISP